MGQLTQARKWKNDGNQNTPKYNRIYYLQADFAYTIATFFTITY